LREKTIITTTTNATTNNITTGISFVSIKTKKLPHPQVGNKKVNSPGYGS